ncbi:hypothetical protein BKA58DRAFT_463049 [Alternaria rosae]|uniref:uncharacterized protein n=1 Tax=Alternaria rosae TaxID=1187941 RepID=UPI001E8D7964|nr:uncharacterized protein BKA58DRAFT_463049 [Alternaria rosae]KAH6865306.1 hypothetical protein BKA58DRAFT_463049 [Alternaria rosae]
MRRHCLINPRHQLSRLSAKEPFAISFDLKPVKTGQQQTQNETDHTERQAVPSGLDAKINGFDVAIAGLMAEQHTLNRTRQYVLSTRDTASGSSGDDNAPAHLAHKLPMRPTCPSRSFLARKVQSSLRQEVLIRNAMEREKSSSLLNSKGLLTSAEFEAAFRPHNLPSGNNESDDGGPGTDNGGDDARLSTEHTSSSVAENHSAPLSATTVNAIPRSTAPSPASGTGAFEPSARIGQGAHWQVKRVTKRKLQGNAAKARSARMRRLNEANSATV